MKFQVKFKTPYVGDQAREEIACQCDGPNSCPDCEPKEDDLYKAQMLMNQFIEHDEYCTIEFDTDTQTASVVRVVK